jgi:mRNA-degrading endonuclease HigB of HigAB toxin-antitoxin module
MVHSIVGERNMTNSTRFVLSVDPGKLSGVSLFTKNEGEDPVMVWSEEATYGNFRVIVRNAFEYAKLHGGKVPEVVCERFVINAQTVRNSQAPFSLEKIGMLKLIMMDWGMEPEELKLQSPADAKAMFDNKKLKILDYWYVGGGGHALDAIRHAVLYFAKTGWIPRKLMG